MESGNNLSKKDIAWNNALSYEIDNPKQFKVCYICYEDFLREKINRNESLMNYDQYDDGSELNGWCVDHVDGNKKNNDPTNLVAVHCDCHKFKKHQDFSYLYKQYKKDSN